MNRYAKDLLFLLVPLAIAVIAYLLLPDQIPLQWRLDGSVRYGSKSTVFLIALVPYVIYLRYRRRD